jgi:hypothetical protein
MGPIQGMLLLVGVFVLLTYVIPFFVNGGRIRRPKRRTKRQKTKPVNWQVEKIRNRADRQNTLWLAGDDRGLYGEYPPADL